MDSTEYICCGGGLFFYKEKDVTDTIFDTILSIFTLYIITWNIY